MPDSTCTVDKCEKTAQSRGLCNTHYSRWRLGKPLNVPVRKRELGRTCSVDGCEGKHDARGLCGKHLTRWQKYGDPLGGPKCKTCGETLQGQGRKAYCSEECRPRCKIEGCDVAARRNGRCSSHDTIFRTKGRDRANVKKWNARPESCPVCGSTEFERGFRAVCSGTCFMRLKRMKRHGVPLVVKCRRCGSEIDRLAGDRLMRSTVKSCRHCKIADRQEHALSAAQLAVRDGTTCTICGDPVDMSLKHPDLFRASVDHVIPKSLGGSNDPENLALAHLWCNIAKGNRLGFSLAV